MKLNIHKVIHKACKRVAFYYAIKPALGEVAQSKLARYPNGVTPVTGSCNCGHCGERISHEELTVERWIKVRGDELVLAKNLFKELV